MSLEDQLRKLSGPSYGETVREVREWGVLHGVQDLIEDVVARVESGESVGASAATAILLAVLERRAESVSAFRNAAVDGIWPLPDLSTDILEGWEEKWLYAERRIQDGGWPLWEDEEARERTAAALDDDWKEQLVDLDLGGVLRLESIARVARWARRVGRKELERGILT